jgi:hypothetical protein
LKNETYFDNWWLFVIIALASKPFNVKRNDLCNI